MILLHNKLNLIIKMSITYCSPNGLYALLKVKYLDLIKQINSNGNCVEIEYEFFGYEESKNEILLKTLKDLDYNLSAEYRLNFQTRYLKGFQTIQLCVFDDGELIFGIKID